MTEPEDLGIMSSGTLETGTISILSEVEQLLSDRLVDGYTLLETACPACATPLVKQDTDDMPELQELLGKTRSSLGMISEVENTTSPVNSPTIMSALSSDSGAQVDAVPGVPFCVKCQAHVVTKADEVLHLEAARHLKVRGTIMVAMSRESLEDETLATVMESLAEDRSISGQETTDTSDQDEPQSPSGGENVDISNDKKEKTVTDKPKSKKEGAKTNKIGDEVDIVESFTASLACSGVQDLSIMDETKKETMFRNAMEKLGNLASPISKTITEGRGGSGNGEAAGRTKGMEAMGPETGVPLPKGDRKKSDEADNLEHEAERNKEVDADETSHEEIEVVPVGLSTDCSNIDNDGLQKKGPNDKALASNENDVSGPKTTTTAEHVVIAPSEEPPTPNIASSSPPVDVKRKHKAPTGITGNNPPKQSDGIVASQLAPSKKSMKDPPNLEKKPREGQQNTRRAFQQKKRNSSPVKDTVDRNRSLIQTSESDTTSRKTAENHHTVPAISTIMTFEERREIATSVLGKKMADGYALTEQQCKKCEMPLMIRDGSYYCVVCPVLREYTKDSYGQSGRGEKKIATKKAAELKTQKEHTTTKNKNGLDDDISRVSSISASFEHPHGPPKTSPSKKKSGARRSPRKHTKSSRRSKSPQKSRRSTRNSRRNPELSDSSNNSDDPDRDFSFEDLKAQAFSALQISPSSPLGKAFSGFKSLIPQTFTSDKDKEDRESKLAASKKEHKRPSTESELAAAIKHENEIIMRETKRLEELEEIRMAQQAGDDSMYGDMCNFVHRRIKEEEKHIKEEIAAAEKARAEAELEARRLADEKRAQKEAMMVEKLEKEAQRMQKEAEEAMKKAQKAVKEVSKAKHQILAETIAQAEASVVAETESIMRSQAEDYHELVVLPTRSDLRSQQWETLRAEGRAILTRRVMAGWTILPDLCKGAECQGSPLLLDGNVKQCVVCGGSGNGQDGIYALPEEENEYDQDLEAIKDSFETSTMIPPVEISTPRLNLRSQKPSSSNQALSKQNVVRSASTQKKLSLAAPTLEDEFESKRDTVTKEIGKRMAQGWSLLDISCPKCVMPLMTDLEQKNEICVLCGVIRERQKDLQGLSNGEAATPDHLKASTVPETTADPSDNSNKPSQDSDEQKVKAIQDPDKQTVEVDENKQVEGSSLPIQVSTKASKSGLDPSAGNSNYVALPQFFREVLTNKTPQNQKGDPPATQGSVASRRGGIDVDGSVCTEPTDMKLGGRKHRKQTNALGRISDDDNSTSSDSDSCSEDDSEDFQRPSRNKKVFTLEIPQDFDLDDTVSLRELIQAARRGPKSSRLGIDTSVTDTHHPMNNPSPGISEAPMPSIPRTPGNLLSPDSSRRTPPPSNVIPATARVVASPGMSSIALSSKTASSAPPLPTGMVNVPTRTFQGPESIPQFRRGETDKDKRPPHPPQLEYDSCSEYRRDEPILESRVEKSAPRYFSKHDALEPPARRRPGSLRLGDVSDHYSYASSASSRPRITPESVMRPRRIVGRSSDFSKEDPSLISNGPMLKLANMVRGSESVKTTYSTAGQSLENPILLEGIPHYGSTPEVIVEAKSASYHEQGRDRATIPTRHTVKAKDVVIVEGGPLDDLLETGNEGERSVSTETLDAVLARIEETKKELERNPSGGKGGTQKSSNLRHLIENLAVAADEIEKQDRMEMRVCF